MAADDLVLRLRAIPLADDDVDAACEAVAAGWCDALVLEEIPVPQDDPDVLTIAFRLSPVIHG